MTNMDLRLPLLLADVRLTLVSSAWWYVLIALLLGGAAYLVYRYTLPPVTPFRRSLLWGLRGCALILIALLLFEPVLSYLFSRRQPPTVALIVDRSASMAGLQNDETRTLLLKRWLTSSAIDKLSDKSQLRIFTFADSTIEVPEDSLENLSFVGVGTDLAGAVDRVQRNLAGENVAALIVVSDGAYNSGENPVRLAAESPAPVHTVGIGDTTANRDAVISQLLTNEITYVGSTVPVELRVRGRGLKDRQANLRLVGAGGKSYGQQTIRFQDDDSEQQVSLTFTAEQAGDLRIVAALDSLPGELLLDNNRRSAIIRVLENKSRVLIFSGPPTPDLTILRQTLEMDSTLHVDLLVEAANGLLYNERTPDEGEIEQADLIILLNYPSRSSNDAVLQRIAKVFAEQDVPLLFFAGAQISMSKLQTVTAALPFNPAKQSLSEERVLLRSAAALPALSGGTPLPKEWSDLPPTVGGLDNFHVKTGAQVAVKLSREALGLSEDEPALAVWQIGRKQGAAFFCWGLYRWRLQNAADTGGPFYDQLISRLIAWLIAPAEEQRVKIRTTKRLYSGGEKVQFVGQVYGSDLTPRDDATINLRVMSGSRSEVVAMRGRGHGRYEGELAPWAEGEYAFSGTASIDQDTLGADRGLFAVEAFNIELIDTRARFDVLSAVSTVSHGRFVPFERADSLLSALEFEPKTVTTRRELPLWNRATLVWIIIGLLGLEWIIRKRSGML